MGRRHDLSCADWAAAVGARADDRLSGSGRSPVELLIRHVPGNELKPGGRGIATRAEQRFSGVVPVLRRIEQSTGKQVTPRSRPLHPRVRPRPPAAPSCWCGQFLGRQDLRHPMRGEVPVDQNPFGCAHHSNVRPTGEASSSYSGPRVGQRVAPSSRDTPRAASATAGASCLAGPRGMIRSVSPTTPMAPTAWPE
jgi:hypothetical protein